MAQVGLADQIEDMVVWLTTPRAKAGETILYRGHDARGDAYYVKRRDRSVGRIPGMSRRAQIVVHGVAHGFVSLVVALLGATLAQRIYRMRSRGPYANGCPAIHEIGRSTQPPPTRKRSRAHVSSSGTTAASIARSKRPIADCGE